MTDEEIKQMVNDRAKFIEQAEAGELKQGGRTFKFKVPQPFEGCVIYNYLSSYEAPFGAFGTHTGLPALPPEKLKEFQTSCLKNCFEVLKSGHEASVVDEDGHFGIDSNTVTAPLLCSLTSGYLIFFVKYWGKESGSISSPAD